MATPADPEQTLTSGEKALMLILAVIGYAIGWYLRTKAGQTGFVPGAIYGGLGAGGGALVAGILIGVGRALRRS